jgi:hypothetical protein
MTRRDPRPPDDEGRAQGPPNAQKVVTTTTSSPALTRTGCRLEFNPRPRRLGLYTSGWKDGFTAGAVDALRQAGRKLPVEVWHVVEELADAYELAADD